VQLGGQLAERPLVGELRVQQPHGLALVDVWKGVGLATVIFIAGIVSTPR
jgi:hypothetical protein